MFVFLGYLPARRQHSPSCTSEHSGAEALERPGLQNKNRRARAQGGDHDLSLLSSSIFHAEAPANTLAANRSLWEPRVRGKGISFPFGRAVVPRGWGWDSVTGMGWEGWARAPRKYGRESRDSPEFFRSLSSPLTCSPGPHYSPVKRTLTSIPNIFETSADR